MADAIFRAVGLVLLMLALGGALRGEDLLLLVAAGAIIGRAVNLDSL